MNDSPIRIGECIIHPALNTIARGGRTIRVQPRAMELLVFLAARPGQVVSTRDLIDGVWSGRVVVDHAVYRLIQQLRDALGDRIEAPRYLETIRKRGYRLIAPVGPDLRVSVTRAAEPKPVLPRLLLAAGSIVLVLLISGLAWLQTNEPPLPSPAASPVFVLITEAWSDTNDAAVHASLSAALGREFSGSPAFQIAPPARIRETLALMRQPEAILTPAIAREVAIRDEALTLVLESQILSAGSTTQVRATLLAPHQNKVIVADEDTLEEAGEFDPQLASFARRLRSSAEAAETDIEFTPLQRVSTRSLSALRNYSEAMAISLAQPGPDHGRRIIELTSAALAIDPQFASAQILLAHFMNNVGSYATETYLGHAEQAFAKAQDTGTEEALFIRGSYEILHGNAAAAVEHFSALVDINPSHYWAVNNLGYAYSMIGDPVRAAAYFAARSDLIPTRADLAAAAARSLTDVGETDGAAAYIARARDLMLDPNVSAAERARVHADVADVRMHRARQLWSDGEIRQLLDELADLEETLDEFSVDERARLATTIAQHYLNLGRTRDAESVLSQHGDPARLGVSGILEIATGQAWPSPDDATITRAPDGASAVNRRLVWALATGNALEEIEPLLQAVRAERLQLQADTGRDRWGFTRVALTELALVEAALLRAKGDDAGADALAGETLAAIAAVGRDNPMLAPISYLSAEKLASRLQARGDVEGAIATLEHAGAGQDRTEIALFSGVFWLRARLMLSELLEQTDPARALAIRSELEGMLEFADQDQRVARALHEL